MYMFAYEKTRELERVVLGVFGACENVRSAMRHRAPLSVRTARASEGASAYKPGLDTPEPRGHCHLDDSASFARSQGSAAPNTPIAPSLAPCLAHRPHVDHEFVRIHPQASPTAWLQRVRVIARHLCGKIGLHNNAAPLEADCQVYILLGLARKASHSDPLSMPIHFCQSKESDEAKLGGHVRLDRGHDSKIRI